MKEFIFNLPTRIFFARGNFKKAGEIIGNTGEKVLLITGKKFAKEFGLVDSLRKQLKNKKLIHYDGITPNPKVKEIERAVEIAKSEKVDLIIALGGGSVMDGAKFISALSVSRGKLWDYIEGKRNFSGAIPLITIPTVPASGSEADPYAVVTNPEKKEKRGFYSPLFYPRIAIWDPELTFTLSLSTLADGVVDIMSHALEGYISGEYAPLQNGFTEVILKEVMNAWERIKNNRDTETDRDILCWASTLAISPFISAGRGGHYVLHGIEHAVSGTYDFISHGSGLAALMIPYLKVVGEKRPNRVASLTKALFDIYHWETGLDEMELWFKKNGLYKTLSDLGAKDIDLIEEIAWRTSKDRLLSVSLTRKDLKQILELAR